MNERLGKILALFLILAPVLWFRFGHWDGEAKAATANFWPFYAVHLLGLIAYLAHEIPAVRARQWRRPLLIVGLMAPWEVYLPGKYFEVYPQWSAMPFLVVHLAFVAALIVTNRRARRVASASPEAAHE